MYYLSQTKTSYQGLDHKGRPCWRFSVQLRATDPRELEIVKNVTYYLHESFKNRIRVVDDPAQDFELSLFTLGEFIINARINLYAGKSAFSALSIYLDSSTITTEKPRKFKVWDCER